MILKGEDRKMEYRENCFSNEIYKKGLFFSSDENLSDSKLNSLFTGDSKDIELESFFSDAISEENEFIFASDCLKKFLPNKLVFGIKLNSESYLSCKSLLYWFETFKNDSQYGKLQKLQLFEKSGYPWLSYFSYEMSFDDFHGEMLRIGKAVKKCPFIYISCIKKTDSNKILVNCAVASDDMYVLKCVCKLLNCDSKEMKEYFFQDDETECIFKSLMELEIPNLDDCSVYKKAY